MARVSRLFIDNACYHVYVRGNQKRTVFGHDDDCERYLNMVKRAKMRYGILLYAYCLMPNHVHMLIDAARGRDISKYMHWLNRGYAAYYNTKYATVGHVWQGRFKSKPIVKGAYLIHCATYIEANPVRAGLVRDIADYKWSSYRERCHLTHTHIIDEIRIDCSYEQMGTCLI